MKTKIELTPDTDVNEAIREYLTVLLSRDGTESESEYLALTLGMATTLGDFEFLFDPSKVDLAYRFAVISNSIPNYNTEHIWYMTSNKLPQQYLQWLVQSVPAPIELSREERKMLMEARRYVQKHINSYWDRKTAYYNALDEYDNWLHMPISERPSDYEKKLAHALRQKERALQEWETRGHRDEYERQYAITNDLSRRDPLLVKQELRDQMGHPINSSHGEFYWTGLLPSALFEPGGSWPRYEIEIVDAGSTGTQADAGGVSTIPLTERSAWDAQPKTIAQIPCANTHISFDMIRLVISRDWFASYLLTGNSWKWSASTPEDPLGGYPLSTGTKEPDGHMVMIPRELVLIRNKRISNAELSAALRTGIAQAHPALAFGPFALRAPTAAELVAEDSSRLAGNKAATIPADRCTEFKQTSAGVEVETVEYFAFICELLPMEPNPDWSLWPKIPYESVKDLRFVTE